MDVVSKSQCVFCEDDVCDNCGICKDEKREEK